ncbi:TPA: hypothetical protein RRT84_005133 [Klebsiella pneumoniae]|nr:hypothetical protein [Klebsiella pneumoniae]
MKNKMGAQMGAFIKMKQEKVYVYQLFYVVCYVPIIAPSNASRFNMPLFLLNKKIFSSAGWRQSTECDCRRRGGALLF